MAEALKQSVIVTGAASGIGRAIAGALGRAGASVVLADVDAPALARARGELADDGARVHAIAADVTRSDEVDGMVAQAFLDAGPVTGLVNCAGVYPVTPFLELRPEEWDRVLAINLRG